MVILSATIATPIRRGDVRAMNEGTEQCHHYRIPTTELARRERESLESVRPGRRSKL